MATATTVRRVRRPSVAGYCYPDDPVELRRAIDGLAPPSAAPQAAVAALAPHGSLRQSGRAAGAVFCAIRMPALLVIIAPNHTGWGPAWSLMAGGAYVTPLGEVPIDDAFAAGLQDACGLVDAEDLAHRGEHAIEVLLPFAQARGPADLRLVPIVTSSEDPAECDAVGEAIAAMVRRAGEPALVVASADLSHFEPRTRAEAVDRTLIDAMTRVDAAGLRERIAQERVATCAAGPAGCMLAAARALGASRGELVSYQTSAKGGGDSGAVVGYAGIVIT